ncbi:transporter substrate-binding domain-containing protein [Picosynechococcus sp. PCC 11901]|uniref:transporter substrate-binding domain-containing protein n=1 Tax=Picosynechococcus sp. PCC 11901 TaxID=2579791 RepID=UPI0010FBD312|nr:transporter substrate-binding domain-containing protein [Picosynechococcus sp. PCC 11901]QCS50654.1 transporter substrate-binding domain-containing protein [Picosynechococcus sp. PCC 11901]
MARGGVFGYGLAIAASFFFGSTSLTQATPLETLQARGILRVAVKDNVRPLGFRDEAGNLQGLEIDIAHQLAAELLGDRQAVELIPLTNQERLDAVLTGEVDLVIAQLGLNASRQRLVNFSPYYYLDGIGFVTRDREIQSLNQINDQRVVVLEGSEAIAAVRAYFPGVTLVGVNSYQEALNYLENNETALFAGDHSVLTGWVQEYPEYQLLPAWLTGNPLAIAFPKGRQHQSLSQALQKTVTDWQNSNWLTERINYWGLPQ